MTQAERIRKFFRENPSKNQKEAYQALKQYGVTENNIYKIALRDTKSEKCDKVLLDEKNSLWTLDYEHYFAAEEEAQEEREWKREIRKELIERLIAINKTEKDSERMRATTKLIDQLLEKV
ncbi:hypothetical protein [Lactococcus lactis]|uniref:Phage protein n=1 Tax=Lactococcus lactis TaxID=1358 RepID=A0AAW5TMK8_9LACT|nr:hypothetical protein [Lactococcus lactis]MCW2279898.1 hypothetical protein [Lactococcus lactis]